MKKTVLLLMSCTIFFSYYTKAQTKEKNLNQIISTLSKKNNIGIQIGGNYSYFKDLNYSPLNYLGRGVLLGINYQRITKKGDIFFSNIDFSSSTIKPNKEIESFEADYYLANLEVGYLKKIPQRNERLVLHIGGGYHTYFNATFYDGVEAISFFALHGIDLTGRLSYRLSSRQQITTSLSVPIFGLMSRPPYTGWDKFIVESQNNPVRVFFRGKWTSFNDYLVVDYDLNYSYKCSPKWAASANYRLQYYKTEQIHSVKSMNQQISLGLNFNF
ncbi:hypothetical protein [Bernardetia sp.]|uniref:hypothetical protein n=1 Tax=Bernardetia sp. TaxID=1937974 RepID=UPI0025B7F2E0|nr:hypothetical protein [Bernardetia sp.]